MIVKEYKNITFLSGWGSSEEFLQDLYRRRRLILGS